MLAGQFLDLVCLRADSIGSFSQVGVDELLVVDVDQRSDEDDRCADDGQTPERYDLDEPVREEGGSAGSKRDGDVLGEKDTLELDDEEVDELLEVLQNNFQSLTGDCVVAFRAEGRGKALREDKLAGRFSYSGCYSCVRFLARPSCIEFSCELTSENEVQHLEGPF